VNSSQPTLLLLTADPVVIRGARKAAAKAGLSVATTADTAEVQPDVIVVDLEQPGAIDRVGELRVDHPDAILVGHLSIPDTERWLQAERAGCDIVANRGAVGRQLANQLDSGTTRRRRFPLLDESDVAGRLGLVVRVEESPFGPVAVYHVDGRISVIEDVCPHAGAQLSAGVVDGCVVTCPRHGSQFDVQTGERLRGPADDAVTAHQVVREAGRVHLAWA
jgi:nitrite reductase/ring-hydroxylating ferredoxin subunit